MNKISIVMTYYNRRGQFLKTLDSIKKGKFSNYEIIVVDDSSNEENRLEDIKDIILIRVDPENKYWINPCIPQNIGLRKATGNLIISQHSECLHYGDILNYVDKNLNDDNYFSFGCYSIPINWDNKFNNKGASFDGDNAWYNHSIYRPVGYHFCSAITKNNLDKIGLYDERYAYGVGYDDDEFIRRIKRFGLDFKIMDNPFVLHQYHYSNGTFVGKSNKELFESES